jgi:starch-binding outer membrane protein, SusD/RagB family
MNRACFSQNTGLHGQNQHAGCIHPLKNNWVRMKILFIIIFFLSAYSCKNDFLDRTPNTSTVIEDYYKTTEDGTNAVTAIYNMLLRDDWAAPFLYSEIASDDCAGGAGTGDGGGYQRIDRGLQLPDADANQTTWEDYYGGIYRANVYLENEGDIDWTGQEALQKQYQAEARFLRAYFHFVLTRMFGEIPALDHTITSDEIPSRTAAADLFAFIIDDLKFAAENALSSQYGSMESDNWGRVTKWAAEAMIARVYLFYSGYYNTSEIDGFTATDARTYIDDVINNSGHGLVDEFASLWRVPTYSELGNISYYAGEVNKEVIWSVRYNITANSNQSYGGAWFEREIGPRSTNIDPYGQGWGAMPVLPSLWETYDASDSRRTATILSWDGEGLTYDYTTNQQAQYTGYNSKKYEIASYGGSPEDIVNGGTNWQFDAFEDYMVVRFADVLLMGAELYVVTNGENDGTALTYINKVRQRAFGDATHNYTTLTLSNVQAERQLELACEGVRYWDILRSCKGDFSKLTSILSYDDSSDGGSYGQTADVESLDVDGSNFYSTKGLFQIPEDEIELMKGAITQNPGYTSN